MSENDLNAVFQQAAAIAAKVPESMQEAAFHRALDELLGSSSSTSGAVSRGKRERRSKARSSSAAQAKEIGRAQSVIERINRTKHPEITNAETVGDKALWVLRIANDEAQIDGLSASEIAEVLKEKFRFSTTHQAVRQSLDRAATFVDRDTSGGVTRYRIMEPGEKYLDGEAPKAPAKAPAKKQKASKAKSSARAKKQPSGQSENSKKKKAARKHSPAQAMIALLEAGYFSEKRTIGAIREHLEHDAGYRYKSTELSPGLLRMIRDKRLRRAKNSDGQYEYFVG